MKVGEEVFIDALPSKKLGKPPLLGEKLDCHLLDKILAMRSRGTPIGTSVVIGIGTGILISTRKQQPALLNSIRNGLKVFYVEWGMRRERLID